MRSMEDRLGRTPSGVGAVAAAALTVGAIALAGAADPAVAAVPQNITPPSITSNPPGTAIVGGELADNGSVWSASGGTRTVQWFDCDASGANCTPITAATTRKYTITDSELGNTLRVSETESNASGSTTATSEPSAVVAEFPSNLSPPVISGQASIGATLTASTGHWTGGGPLSYSYQWFACPFDCTEPIPEATGSTYTVPRTSAGAAFEVLVTASDDASGLSTGQYSQAVRIALPSTPTNTTRPRILGRPVAGGTLSVNPGAWRQDPSPLAGTIYYTYQWNLCGSLCNIPIVGATAPTFTPTLFDTGRGLSVLVTATDGIGAGQQYSVSIGVIPSDGLARPWTRSSLGRLLRAVVGTCTVAVLRGARGCPLTYMAIGTGRLRIRALGGDGASLASAAAALHLPVGPGGVIHTTAFASPTPLQVALTLTRAGRRHRLAAPGRRLRLTASYLIADMTRPVTVTEAVTIRHGRLVVVR
jgi:hypothetical protein